MGRQVYKEIKFDGKLITSSDPATIGNNFQDLINMRYTNKTVKGITGMTKINTGVIPTYVHIANGFHFKKRRPGANYESHILIQAADNGDANSSVLQNSTTIPNQGDFSTTVLWTDTTGHGMGRFSDAPDGQVAYCNGKDACIWGGNENRVAKFINFALNNAFKYDYTKQVGNTLNDTNNIAVLKQQSGTGIDANVMLLLHCDGSEGSQTFTDSSPTTPHTVTAVDNTKITTADFKFGTAAAYFDGTGDWLTTPDNADFDFSGGIFTIDGWIKVEDLASKRSICSQGSGAGDYFNFHIQSTGRLEILVYVGSSNVVYLLTDEGVISANTWHHVALVEDGNEWYLFVDGNLKAQKTDTSRLGDYTGLLTIGAYNNNVLIQDPFKGWMDEFRISNVARWTADFIPDTDAYGTEAKTYLYVASTRPLQGIKFYIETANTTTGTLEGFYWNGVAWKGLTTLVDGTENGGKPFAQTGAITFDSTATLAKLKVIDGIVLYWYGFIVTDMDETTSVNYVTVDAPFQTVKDIWGGVFRTALSYQVFKTSFENNTVNVFDDSYDSQNTATFADISALATSQYQVVGFGQRMMGLNIGLIGGSINDTAGTILTIQYWTGQAWVNVGNVDDGTLENGVTFAKSGVISWSPPDENLEFKREISKELPLYYYKLIFTANLSADVKIYNIGGIPAQEEIRGFKFPLFAKNRLWLCCNEDKEKNLVKVSAGNATEVWNGDDTIDLYMGDETKILAATSLYSRIGSRLYDVTLFFKRHSLFGVIGNSPLDFEVYQISNSKGCPAPLTLKTVDITTEGFTRTVAIWLAADGVCIFDNNSTIEVDADLKDIFDGSATSGWVLNKSQINSAIAFVDKINQEYHLLYASGSSTTLDKEIVLDLKKFRWFKVHRTATKKLQCGFEVSDSNGNNYSYGCIDAGYMERLENGTSFDGIDTQHTVHIGEMVGSKEGSIFSESNMIRHKLIMKAKEVVAQNVAVTHYGDGIISGTALTALNPSNSGYRLTDKLSDDFNTGSQLNKPFVFHSIKYYVIQNAEAPSFEPIYAGFLFDEIRKDKT